MNKCRIEPFVEETPDIIRLTGHDDDDVRSSSRSMFNKSDQTEVNEEKSTLISFFCLFVHPFSIGLKIIIDFVDIQAEHQLFIIVLIKIESSVFIQ